MWTLSWWDFLNPKPFVSLRGNFLRSSCVFCVQPRAVHIFSCASVSTVYGFYVPLNPFSVLCAFYCERSYCVWIYDAVTSCSALVVPFVVIKVRVMFELCLNEMRPRFVLRFCLLACQSLSLSCLLYCITSFAVKRALRPLWEISLYSLPFESYVHFLQRHFVKFTFLDCLLNFMKFMFIPLCFRCLSWFPFCSMISVLIVRIFPWFSRPDDFDVSNFSEIPYVFFLVKTVNRPHPYVFKRRQVKIHVVEPFAFCLSPHTHNTLTYARHFIQTRHSFSMIPWHPLFWWPEIP